MSEPTLKDKTAKGLLWGAINNGVQQLLGLIFGVVLLQILLPEDYGMVGMILIFAGISSVLQESGFIAGLTQKPHITPEDLNAVFWFNILCGGLLYLLLFFCAPLIAHFLDEPALLPLSRVFFLGFLISSFGIVPRAILFRQLMTKQNAKVGIISLFVSGIAGVAMALQGFAYWSLAIQTLTFCTCVTLLSWHYARWRPMWSFDLRPLRSMIGFSSKLLITDICQQANIHLMSFVLGKFYHKTDVGHYTQGAKWTSMGTQVISGMVYGVAQPTFARLQDEPERVRRAFGKMLRFTAFVAFPALWGLALVAPEMIIIAFPDRWLAVIPYMQILCIGAAFLPIQQLYTQFITGSGKSDIYMYNTIALGLLQILLTLALLPFGIMTMLCGYVTLNVSYLFVWHFFVRRLSGITYGSALRDVIPFGCVTVCILLATHFVTVSLDPPLLRLTTKVLTAAVLYVGVMKLLKVKTLEDCLHYILKRKSPPPSDETP